MKKLHINIFTFLIIAFTTSCLEVKFSEPQPQGINELIEFPVSLRGNYVNQDGDTLVIEQTVVSLLNRKSRCDLLIEKDSLCESVILKNWSGYYFLSIYEDQLWSCVLVEQDDNRNLIVSMIDAESEKVITKLNSIITVDTVFTEDREIVHFKIDPDLDQLHELILKEVFSQQYIFKKIKE